MWAREFSSGRPMKTSGELIKVPLKGVVLSHPAQRASPRASPNLPVGLSFSIIRMPQATRVARVHTFRRPVIVNIKAWIIAWKRRGAERTP